MYSIILVTLFAGAAFSESASEHPLEVCREVGEDFHHCVVEQHETLGPWWVENCSPSEKCQEFVAEELSKATEEGSEEVEEEMDADLDVSTSLPARVKRGGKGKGNGKGKGKGQHPCGRKDFSCLEDAAAELPACDAEQNAAVECVQKVLGSQETSAAFRYFL